MLFIYFQPIIKQILPHTTLQRQVKAHKNVHIPRFYFPAGKPGTLDSFETVCKKIRNLFVKLGERAVREHFGQITSVCNLPLYWKIPLFLAACADTGGCTVEQFINFWSRYVKFLLKICYKKLILFKIYFLYRISYICFNCKLVLNYVISVKTYKTTPRPTATL